MAFLLFITLLISAAVGPSAAGPLIPDGKSPPPPPPPPPPPAMSPKPSFPPIYKGLTVGGQICCSPTGQCPGNHQPVGVAMATLMCAGDCDIGVGKQLVDKNGRFNITIPSSRRLNFTSPFIPCFVEIKLPTILDGNKCEVLSNTTGVLASDLQSTGTGYMSSLGGMVRNATINGFKYYPD